ncbi:2-isopropylmalate synthase [Helicobacter sp. 11S02596-1]|uniref:2-isopropylmalate synthase n=1 Tax=Helicobacter sp. 11S02596-1 TaxID=1476194 RepID=UPI000BA7BF57|nr:2-isopropylmalate synthase [Helicobacter sp. 11S02596-1]PAF44742.1 2-isopropylmalate synthase [Helicobacter sp. 11S02596-1]
MSEMIKIFDTTLRDGEQSPGASMNIEEKIKVAKQLERLGVDVIEAGFAASSPGDFEAIERISQVIKTSTICSLCRAVEKDIWSAAQALKSAQSKRLHIFIATSNIHMEYKLKMKPDEVIKRAVNAIAYAKTLASDIQFSCEDASRSDMGFLKEILTAVVEAGATTLNLPDTVGYALPEEMGKIIAEFSYLTQQGIVLSVHCHDDLGLAVANSIAGVQNGARQVECTINALGERGGNTALEEVVMILKTRKELFNGLDTRITTQEIYPTSKLVADVTGIKPQPNKAIVGQNAFAHESGIHQDGMLKNPQTYEIIKPADVGIIQNNTLVLGKHSGRAAFRDKIKSLGFSVDDEELNKAFERFKVLCDSKKQVFDDDIRAILNEETTHIPQVFALELTQISASSAGKYCAVVSITKDGVAYSDCALGNGSVDSILKSIDRITGITGNLKDYQVESVSSGKDALAKVVVRVVFEANKPAIMGHGIDLDTMSATAKAYVSALNSYLSMKDLLKSSPKENT